MRPSALYLDASGSAAAASTSVKVCMGDACQRLLRASAHASPSSTGCCDATLEVAAAMRTDPLEREAGEHVRGLGLGGESAMKRNLCYRGGDIHGNLSDRRPRRINAAWREAVPG